MSFFRKHAFVIGRVTKVTLCAFLFALCSVTLAQSAGDRAADVDPFLEPYHFNYAARPLKPTVQDSVSGGCLPRPLRLTTVAEVELRRLGLGVWKEGSEIKEIASVAFEIIALGGETSTVGGEKAGCVASISVSIRPTVMLANEAPAYFAFPEIWGDRTIFISSGDVQRQAEQWVTEKVQEFFLSTKR